MTASLAIIAFTFKPINSYRMSPVLQACFYETKPTKPEYCTKHKKTRQIQTTKSNSQTRLPNEVNFYCVKTH